MGVGVLELKDSPVINYVGPEDSAISSGALPPLPTSSCASDTPRALALPSARLLSDCLGRQTTRPLPRQGKGTLRGLLCGLAAFEPMFCQLGGWEEGLWAGVGWESQPWGKHCRKQDDEVGARGAFQEPGNFQPRETIPAAAGLLGPEQEEGAAGPLLQEGRRKSRGGEKRAAFPQKGGLRGAQGGSPRPEARAPATSAMSYARFPALGVLLPQLCG